MASPEITELFLGTVEGDETGTKGRDGGQIINDNFNLIKSTFEALGIADILGLQTALDGKAATHSHPYAPDSHVGGNAHIDWTVTGAEVIHADRYTDTVYTHPANHSWSILTGTPTTLAGYGITDAASSSQCVPDRGTAGQVLAKKSTTDYDTEWVDGAGAMNHGATYPANNLEYTGITEVFIAFGTVSAGYVVALSQDASRAEVVNADADTNRPVIGVCVEGGASGTPVTVLTRGVVKLTGVQYSVNGGEFAYVSTTAGFMTHTKPSATGDFIQIVGYGLATDVLYVNPQFNWVEAA